MSLIMATSVQLDDTLVEAVSIIRCEEFPQRELSNVGMGGFEQRVVTVTHDDFIRRY
jgi:hypothetical protein